MIWMIMLIIYVHRQQNFMMFFEAVVRRTQCAGGELAVQATKRWAIIWRRPVSDRIWAQTSTRWSRRSLLGVQIEPWHLSLCADAALGMVLPCHGWFVHFRLFVRRFGAFCLVLRLLSFRCFFSLVLHVCNGCPEVGASGIECSNHGMQWCFICIYHVIGLLGYWCCDVVELHNKGGFRWFGHVLNRAILALHEHSACTFWCRVATLPAIFLSLVWFVAVHSQLSMAQNLAASRFCTGMVSQHAWQRLEQFVATFMAACVKGPDPLPGNSTQWILCWSIVAYCGWDSLPMVMAIGNCYESDQCGCWQPKCYELGGPAAELQLDIILLHC